MKKLLLSFFLLTLSCFVFAQHQQNQANEIIQFLQGSWHNYSIIVEDGKAVDKTDYKETMTIKNASTLSITAHDFHEGEDLTRDMTLILEGDKITMKQGSFEAKGLKEGNVYYLKGFYNELEFRFRLYTMGDKYVFHSETWNNGNIEQINMSYLLRQD